MLLVARGCTVIVGLKSLGDGECSIPLNKKRRASILFDHVLVYGHIIRRKPPLFCNYNLRLLQLVNRPSNHAQRLTRRFLKLFVRFLFQVNLKKRDKGALNGGYDKGDPY